MNEERKEGRKEEEKGRKTVLLKQLSREVISSCSISSNEVAGTTRVRERKGR